LTNSATRTRQPWEDPSFEPESFVYTSMILPLLINGLKKPQESQTLDVGPVCSENINFFARQVKRLYVCDMFLRLDRDRRKGLAPNRVWQHLDYPPESFDGIILWDFCDRLDDKDVARMVELCHTMVKPMGMVMISALGEQEVMPVVNSFVIGDDFQVYLRPQPHLDLRFHGRQNRDVLALFSPFTSVKSLIYRNGLREFLFQRN